MQFFQGCFMAKSNFRIHKNHNYTIMSNYHLFEKDMSLSAKGLLSLMLSLPATKNYPVFILSTMCKESESNILSTLKELERFGYVKITETTPTCVYEVFGYPSEKGVVCG